FFSSRRRHTRSYGDWSSDVCSSDLLCEEGNVCLFIIQAPYHFIRSISLMFIVSLFLNMAITIPRPTAASAAATVITKMAKTWPRSEERRVGKECRAGRGREG